MDSTIYTNQKIPSNIFEEEFITIKGHGLNILPFCRYRWVYFLIGGTNSCLFDYLYNLLISYWRQYQYPISYFLVDYFIEVVCQYDWKANALMDAVPINNINCFKLDTAICSQLNKSNIEILLNDPDEIFYKLSHRNSLNIESFNYFKEKVLSKNIRKDNI